MDNTNHLKNLLEASDLLAMLEELIQNSGGKLNPSTLSGLRLSIRNAKEIVLSSHDSIAQALLQRNKQDASSAAHATSQALSSGSQAVSVQGMAQQAQRKDLRSSLERIIGQ